MPHTSQPHAPRTTSWRNSLAQRNLPMTHITSNAQAGYPFACFSTAPAQLP